MKKPMTWRRFGLSMLDAGINSGSTSVTVMLVDPADFNLFDGGAMKLGALLLVGFLSGVFSFLRSHRLPGVEDVEDEKGVGV